MTFTNFLIMALILAVATVGSMLYYGGRGKKQMRRSFEALAQEIGGTMTPKGNRGYPQVKGQIGGRPVEVFIHLSEGHRKTSDIIYLVLSTPTRLPSATLVIQEGYFSATQQEQPFNDVAGDYLEGLLPGRYVYGASEAESRRLFADGTLAPRLLALERYPNIVLGPDAVTIGKQYAGAQEIEPSRLRADLDQLAALGTALENIPAEPTTTRA